MDAVSEIVERLGGPSRLASRFGIGTKAIEMWVRREGIPGRWHIPLLLLAAELGVELSLTELLSAEPTQANPQYAEAAQ